MISSLTGRVAMVTGGGTGIGRGITELLVSKGCTVAIAGRDQKKAETAAKELNEKYKVSGDNQSELVI